MRKVTLDVGKVNAAVAAATNRGSMFTLVSPISQTWYIEGFILSYNGAAQAPVQLILRSNPDAMDIVQGEPQFCNVGYDRTLAHLKTMVRFAEPVMLAGEGQKMEAFAITPAGVALAAADVGMTFFGFYQAP